jgi:hypothetical protein
MGKPKHEIHTFSQDRVSVSEGDGLTRLVSCVLKKPTPLLDRITPLKVQKYNIENQWLETSLDDLPHSQVRRSTESDRGESGSYVESPSGHL